MNNWRRGHITRIWDKESFKKFEYIRQPISQAEIDEWHSKGYDYVKSFTGSMYDNRNPMPDWIEKIPDMFGRHNFINFTYTFYKMTTLEIMPEHSDHYQTYMKLYNAEYKNVCRILIMLEDWKPGHYLEINGVGIVNWIAGDYFIWENSCPHAASNIGVEDRYTLQITCEKINWTGQWDSDKIWKNIHYYNIPDLETINESTSPLMLRLVEACNNNNGNPWMVYMLNERINQLSEIRHTPEAIQYLNDRGLVIYLYEPICSYIEGAKQLRPPTGTKHTRWFYSEFREKIDPVKMRCDELDSIREYIINNNLTNVTVKTCDYDIDKYYPYYLTHMNLVTDDLFVKTIIPTNPENPEIAHKFTRKFICLNWRYTPHRHLIAAYASTKDSLVSWYFRSDLYTIHKDVWYNIYGWEKSNPKAFSAMLNGIQNLNANAPMNVDMNIIDAVMITDNYLMDYWPVSNIRAPGNTNPETNVLERFYNKVFCDIVTESRFAQPTGNFSEKVYQPMFYKKPFILCAPPYTLKYLKEEGFKTFSDFWDESYDECENHQERLFKIFKVIDTINDKSMDELREMYSKMDDILEYNRNLLNKKVIPV